MSPSQGGPAQGIRNSIPALKSLGIVNEVVCFDTGSEAYCGQDDFKIYYLGPPKGPYAYCVDFEPWLSQHIVNYSIVIIHGLWLYNSFGTFKVWSKLEKKGIHGPKLFIMPHGMLDPYFQKARDRRLKAFRNSVFWHLFERKVINGVDGVLFTCQRELELARETFNGYSPKKEINITYGVQAPPSFEESMELDFFKKSGLKKGESFILFLSRVHSKKGVDLLIKAYIDLKDKNGLGDLAKLVIAGPLDSRFSDGLIHLTKDRDDIIFTGMLQGNAKWGALYLSEAFVLPSHQENFGIAVAEALACGTPVLISDKVNIYKEILDANAGFVNEDSEKGVQDLLVEWYTAKPEKKVETGKNAFSLYKAKFSIENSAKVMADKLIQSNSF